MANNATILISCRVEPIENPPLGKTYIWITADGHIWTKISTGDKVDHGASGGDSGSSMWEMNPLNNEGLRPINNYEIAVGQPTGGRESVFGYGDSFGSLSSMVVYSYDGVSYTDRTASVISDDELSMSFDGITDGNAIYIGCLLSDGTDKIKFPGLKLAIDAATDLGVGDIVFEFFSGSGWIEFNHQATDSGDRHLPHGNDRMTLTGSFQYIFDSRVKDDWVKVDPVGLGEAFYWMRMRVLGGITSSPVINRVKLHSKGRIELNEDGSQTFYGDCMPRRSIPVPFGNLPPNTDSPGDKNIFFSKNLSIGVRENLFQDATTDRSGFIVPVPVDLCTACPMVLGFDFFGNEDRPAGDVEFITRWAVIHIDSLVYDTETDAPSIHPDERSITGTYAMEDASQYKMKHVDIELDVPYAIAESVNREKAYLVVTFQRNGSADSFSGDIVIANMSMDYSSFKLGGHL